MIMDIEYSNDVFKQYITSIDGIELNEEISDQPPDLEDSIIFANHISDDSISLAIMSGGSTHKGIPIRNILVPDLDYYTYTKNRSFEDSAIRRDEEKKTEIDLEILNDKEHLEFKKLKEELDNNKFYFESKRYQLGFHYFYVLEDSTFQPYFSSKPVFMDTMFEHLGSDNRHKSKDQLVTNYTTDKNLTKILLREHGIPVARDRIITRKNISKLEKIIKDFTFKTQSKSLVFKANNGSCGDEVIITHPNETKKIKQFVNKHLEYGIVLLEERLIPRKFKVNRQKLDANMRILAILTDHCEYVGGVVRMQSWGNKPVNLSGAANRYNLEDYAKEVNFTINELAEFTRKAGQPLADIRQEHHPIMLGLDITLTDNEFHVIEINSSGSAGYHSLGLTTNHNQPRVKYMVSKL